MLECVQVCTVYDGMWLCMDTVHWNVCMCVYCVYVSGFMHMHSLCVCFEEGTLCVCFGAYTSVYTMCMCWDVFILCMCCVVCMFVHTLCVDKCACVCSKLVSFHLCSHYVLTCVHVCSVFDCVGDCTYYVYIMHMC